MDGYGGRRNKSEQDAWTVEIGYALLSAVLVAGVAFGAVGGPALLFDLPRMLSTVLLRVGGTLAALAFVARVVGVLVSFGQRAQPSQPGRTSPDS
ncbi:DUF6332 family protein [Streptomyces sp. NPDC001544]|uniref:DUF6332 family protein n=1 Tax=Streptomyces sp. NPDC001544 TaxID=3364584 RepID=UPI00368B205F